MTATPSLQPSFAELGSHVADVDLFPPSLEDIYTQISRRDAA